MQLTVPILQRLFAFYCMLQVTDNIYIAGKAAFVCNRAMTKANKKRRDVGCGSFYDPFVRRRLFNIATLGHL
jgi:hypothetical protein